jgi:hypothetical protein
MEAEYDPADIKRALADLPPVRKRPKAYACETIPDSILQPMRRCPDYPDFPTAWAIQNDRGVHLDHDPRCSSVPGWHPASGPGLLCDCGAVVREWERLREIEGRM